MAEKSDEAAKRKWDRTFARRQRAAVEGLHLPSVEELLCGMPFLRCAIKQDAQEFANRALLRLRGNGEEDTPLGSSLKIFTVSTEESDFIRARKAFEGHPSTRKNEGFLAEGARRCQYYAASCGDQRNMLDIASYAAFLADIYSTPPDIGFKLGVTAIGWLRATTMFSYRRGDLHGSIFRTGTEFFDFLRRRYEAAIAAESTAQSDAGSTKQGRGQTEQDVTDEDQAASASSVQSIVVIKDVGNADINLGSSIRREFSKIIGVELPLCPVPNLAEAKRSILRHYPFVSELVERTFSDLNGEDHVRLRPLLFVGPAGCGKTSFAQELFRVLGVPSEVFPCGGVGDSALMGTARRWASGEPSLPLSLVRRYGVASPGIVLDEIEKSGRSRHNGNLTDCLLGLLEPQSASVWRDPYVQTPVNLSHVIWIATANSLSGISSTLLDRLTLIEFPVPDQSHIEALGNNLLKGLIRSRRLDERWYYPLTAEELTALRASWPGGSIRQLQRLVAVVFNARDQWTVLH